MSSLLSCLSRWVVLLALLVACSAQAADPRVKMDPEHELIRLSPAALIWHDVKGERNLEDWRSAIDNPSGGAAARTHPVVRPSEGATSIVAPVQTPLPLIWYAIMIYPAKM